jgi:methionyl-tRNA formyltransferase
LPAPEPQEGEPTYAAKLAPEELRIDWSRAAAELDRVVRIGGAWTTFRGTRLKVWRSEVVASTDADARLLPGEIDPRELLVGTGADRLRLTLVQPEGKSRQAADAWRNGAHLHPGDRLGEEIDRDG